MQVKVQSPVWLRKDWDISILILGHFTVPLALYLTRKGVDPEGPDDKIVNAAKGAEIRLDGERVFLNDEDVSDAIRTPEAGHHASVFSARKSVREYLFKIQKDAGQSCDIVAEGRDMTTVVFPNAKVKIYLDASEDGTRCEALSSTQ